MTGTEQRDRRWTGCGSRLVSSSTCSFVARPARGEPAVGPDETAGAHIFDHRARGVDTRSLALRPEDVPAAARLYESGWTLEQLDERYRVGSETVRARLVADMLYAVRLARRWSDRPGAQPG